MTWENRVYSGRENKLNIIPLFICTLARNSSRFLCLLCAIHNFPEVFHILIRTIEKEESIGSIQLCLQNVSYNKCESLEFIRENCSERYNRGKWKNYFSFFFESRICIMIDTLVLLVASFLPIYDSIRKIIGIKIRDNKKYKSMKKELGFGSTLECIDPWPRSGLRFKRGPRLNYQYDRFRV